MLTLFDYLVLFVLVTSTIIGVMRGLIYEVLSLAGWVVAFLVANAYGVKLAAMLPFEEHSIRLVVAFIALFIGTRLLMSLLMLAVDGLIKATGLKMADRSLGSLFGFAKGVIFILAFMLLAGMTSLPQQAFWRHALLRPAMEKVALEIKPYLPGAIAQHVHFK